MQCGANLEGVLAGAAKAAFVVNESGTILYATDQACHVLKYAPGELCGQSVELLIPARFRLAHIGHHLRFTDDRRTRPMGAGLPLFALCKDGSELPVDLSSSRFSADWKILLSWGYTSASPGPGYSEVQGLWRIWRSRVNSAPNRCAF